jgi:putative CocE/NonD family hydrolase
MKILICCGLFAAAALAQTPEETARKQLAYTRAHYTKYEYRIPMRDGVKLFTSVYVPKDVRERYPMMMQRTPYSVGPYGIDNYPRILGPSELFTKEGFIFVYQDVRGRYLSEGHFIDVPIHKGKVDESTDTYDTVDWLVKNVPDNNGKVGMWGISYPGFYAAFALIDAHPALVAVSPQAPMGDVGNGDDAYHNGAFYLAANFGFYSSFKPRGDQPERPKRALPFDFENPDQYDFYLKMGPLSNSNTRYLKNENAYWNETLEHPNYDEFWQSRGLAQFMKNVHPAVLFVGGWFDAEDLSGPLKLFHALEHNGPSAADTLVMGPWRHGGWARGSGETLGNLAFNSDTAEYFREHIEFPFFVQNLKGKSSSLKDQDKEPMPKAWVFETGEDQWRRFDSWPPKSSTPLSLYLAAGGKLTFAPANSGDFDEYTSDPARPVPVIGDVGDGMPGDYMTYDQRFASKRPDVLVYETEPLDHDVAVTGPVTASLIVSTSGTDSDFVVKLIDVYPNDYPNPDPNPAKVHMGGYQQLVRGEPFRGRFRKSMSKPEAFTPGKQEKIEFSMPDAGHVFRPGHRIMVQVQSSWFPLVDRNPQTFVNIPSAKESDFQKAVERVYRGSYLRVMSSTP